MFQGINLKELAVTNSFFLRKSFSERDLHGDEDEDEVNMRGYWQEFISLIISIFLK